MKAPVVELTLTAPPPVLVVGALKLRSPLGSEANTADPVTVPVLGSAVPTIGVPATGAGSTAFSILRAKANKNVWNGFPGLGIGLDGFIPPSDSRKPATKFATPSNGLTATGGGGAGVVTLAAGTTEAPTDGVITAAFESAGFDIDGLGLVASEDRDSAPVCDTVGPELSCGPDEAGPDGPDVPAEPEAPLPVVGVDTMAAECFGVGMPLLAPVEPIVIVAVVLLEPMLGA